MDARLQTAVSSGAVVYDPAGAAVRIGAGQMLRLSADGVARVSPIEAETVAAWREFTPAFLPLPHPSWRNTGWLKRNGWFEDDVLPYLRRRVTDILAP